MSSSSVGGGITPDWKLLDQVLRPKKNAKKYSEGKIRSAALNKTINVWFDSSKDLTRIDKLEMNGKTLIDKKEGLDAISADMVFDKILSHVNNDEKVAKSISNLLCQALFADSQKLVEEKKEMVKIDKKKHRIYNSIFSGKDRIYSFEQKGTKFKLEEEILYRKMPNPETVGDIDPEDFTFLKEKIIIEGNISDLQAPTEKKSKKY